MRGRVGENALGVSMALVTQDEAYPGQSRILADIQLAIRRGDRQGTEALQRLDHELERQAFHPRSWHEVDEIIRVRGVEYWPAIAGLFRDIPEHISRPAGELHRSKQVRERVRHWGVAVVTVLALGGLGWSARGSEVLAREGAVVESEAAIKRRWANHIELRRRLAERQLAESPPEENVPIYHVPEEEIQDARRQDHDNGN